MTITDVEYKLQDALDAYISALKAIPFYDESELSAIQDNQHVAECLENAEKAIDYVQNGRSYEALAMVYLSRREGIIELYKATKAIAEELAAKTLIQRLETVAGTEGTGQEHAKKALEHARPWQGLAKDESRMRKVIGPVRQAGKELRREDYALNEFMWALKFDEARVSNPSAEHDGILKGYIKQLDEEIILFDSREPPIAPFDHITLENIHNLKPPTTGVLGEFLRNLKPRNMNMDEFKTVWPNDEGIDELLRILEEADDY